MIRVKENDARFCIKDSTLPGAGFGLFAKQPLKKGQYLEIIGIMVQRESVADQCTAFANNYKFGVKDGEEVWHIIPLGYAGMINQANEKSQQNCEIVTVRAKVSKKKIKSNKDFFAYSGESVYLFTRDIAKDEEILGNYGREWKKQQDWVNQYQKAYEDNVKDWIQFLNYGLYNMPILREIIPLEELNVSNGQWANAGNTILMPGDN